MKRAKEAAVQYQALQCLATMEVKSSWAAMSSINCGLALTAPRR
jgi:hypothetical protein